MTYLFERHGAKWPFALALLALMGVFFAVDLAEDVIEGDTEALDAWVFTLFHRADTLAPRGPLWLRDAMIDVTALGSNTVLIVMSVLAAGYALAVRRRDRFLLIACTSGGAALLSGVLKKLIARERPSSIEPLVDVSSFSFPSGHALASMAIYLAFALIAAETAPSHIARAFIILSGFALAFVTGISRIYLGVHYLTDVVAGWTIGTCWALACWLGARWLLSRRRKAA